MSQGCSNIDLTLSHQPEDISSWIGQGRVYKDVPDLVSNELLQRLSLSEESQGILPSYDLTISEFLRLDLFPRIDSRLVLDSPMACFSDIHPNTTTAFLLTRDLPSREFLTGLRAVAGQAMLDGKLSIGDWSNNNIYLPFEALTFWDVLLEVASAKNSWSNRKAWKARQKGIPDEMNIRIERIFDVTPWRTRLLPLGGHVTVTEMADYFSRLELSGSHVDTLLEHVRIHLTGNNQLTDVIIANTTFFDFLSQIEHYHPDFATMEAQKIGNHLKAHSHALSILGVAYSPPRHWAAVLIQVSPSGIEVHWGDSIQRGRPMSLTQGVKTFLEFYLDSSRLITFHDDLECAFQTDGYSCPIISLNTIKHRLFGTALWTEKTREQIRINEFVDAMEFCFLDSIDLSTLSSLQIHPSLSNPEPTPALPLHSEHSHVSTLTSLAAKPPSGILSFFLPRQQTKKRSHSKENLNLTGPKPTDLQIPLKKRQRITADRTPKVRSQKAENEGSKTAIRKRALNNAVRSGTFVLDPAKWEKYVDKLKELDSQVEVDATDPTKACQVRHSRCSQYLIMATVYDVTVFKNHIKRCAEKMKLLNPAANTRTLNALGVLSIATGRSKKDMNVNVSTKPMVWPCPGLTKRDDKRIGQYLKRVSTLSAGGISEQMVTNNLWEGQRSLRSLTDVERDAVRIEQINTHRWRNDHELKRVFAIGKSPCLQSVPLPLNHKLGDVVPPCASCQSLFKLREFLNAISRPNPAPKNKSHTPHQYQNRILGEKYARNQGLAMLLEGSDSEEEESDILNQTPDYMTQSKKKDVFLRFARQLSEGRFDKKPVFLDLVAVMTDTAEREARGRGMQNKKYPPAYNDWLHELQCIRPEAYRSFISTFGGRSERSFQHIRSLKPSFTQGISHQTLELAKQYISDYNYPKSGPLAIGVDDTKLLPSLRPYYDSAQQKWFLLGSVGEPLEVMDINLLQKQIADAALLKAEKLRLWTLSIPLPDVPTLVLAGCPISPRTTASELTAMDIILLELLFDSGFTIISLGSDGATVEREARRELVRKKFAYYAHYSIPHPDSSQPPLEFKFLRKGTHAMVIIQDPLHARKTMRNGMFSGAKCLTLGRYLVYYEQARNLAFQDGSPLYTRDVDKLDRQDDRAAARLFSGSMLEFTIENLADELGLVIYLFVFGEMVDAYQSRQITHLDRVKMVLRAYFFKDLWKKFLEENDYPMSQHYMSKEADDITDTIINGLISLIIIHRDYLEEPFPLLPWPHGSSPGEHVFGFLRDYFPDFTMLDVLRLIPKIRVRLMAACRKKKMKADFRKTASGYSHTYFDATDANLQLLAMFPTDEEIQAIAATAYDEAVSLWVLLGYSPGGSVEDPKESSNKEGVEDTEDETSICCDTIEPTVEPSDRCDLEEALESAAELCSRSFPSEKTDTALDECGYAAAVLNINDIDAIESLPSDDPAALDEIRSALAEILSTIAASNASGCDTVMQLIKQAKSGNGRDIPLGVIPNPSATSSIPAISNISDTNLMELVSIRMKNQCRDGAEGVRTRKISPTDNSTTGRKSQLLSDRQKLAKKIHEIVRLEESEKGLSSGLNQRVRWEKTAAGSIVMNSANVLTGNSANAQVAARAGANDVIKRRRREFLGMPGISPDDLATAKVNLISKLTRGSFGIVIYEGELMIGRVITMYEKGGGKAARHAWVSETASMGSISYISMQIWKQTTRTQRYFRAIWHPKLKQHGLPRFAHIPGNAFIYYVPNSSIRSISNYTTLELLPSFFDAVFLKLLIQEKPIVETVRRLLKRPTSKPSGSIGDEMIE